MLGGALPEPFPAAVSEAVTALHASLSANVRPVRIGWVHDGAVTWNLHLHVEAKRSTELAIVDGDAEQGWEIDASAGLAALRALPETFLVDAGVPLRYRIGLPSPVADLLCRCTVRSA